MTIKVGNRVKETTTTVGTGTINLAGAPTGFRSFADEFTDGDSVYYLIVDDPSNPTAYEYGIGTFTDDTPDTLARTTVLGSSNSDALVSFASGSKTVISTPVAEMFGGGGPLPGDRFFEETTTSGWHQAILSSSHGDDEGAWYTWNAYWDQDNEQWSREDTTLIAFAFHFGKIPGEASDTYGMNFWRALDSSYSAEVPDRLIDPDFAQQGGWELLQTWTEFQTSAMGGGVLEGDGSGSTHGFSRLLLPHNTTGNIWHLGLIHNSFPSRDAMDTTADFGFFEGIEFDVSSGEVWIVNQWANAVGGGGGAPTFADITRQRIDNFDTSNAQAGMVIKGPTTTYSAPFLTDGAQTAVNHYLLAAPDGFIVKLVNQTADNNWGGTSEVHIPPTACSVKDQGGTTIPGTGIGFKVTASQFQVLVGESILVQDFNNGRPASADKNDWDLLVTPWRIWTD